MSVIIQDLLQFLDQSPTSWHAAMQIGTRLAEASFSPLNENENWELKSGGKYFITRDDGALIAFCLPKEELKKATIVASHTDSPGLKLKPQSAIKNGAIAQFAVEIYGGPLLTSWLNRDLGLAGRILVKTINGQLESRLININDSGFIIPQLPVHLDRDVNEKGLLLDKEKHLCPIIGLEDFDLEDLLINYQTYESLLGFDLFLYPLESASILGLKQDMIASYRLDNLCSAHAALIGILNTKPQKEALQIAVFFDHEEVGSQTHVGAGSTFLLDTMERICKDRNSFLRAKQNSFCLSVDVTHGFNPNYPQRFDIPNTPLLGKGIAIKFNAKQRYATNALSATHVIEWCRKANISYQTFCIHGQIPSGSTIGPILSSNLGILTADIGVPSLSMHSARELISVKDQLEMSRLITTVLQEPIEVVEQ